MTLKYKISFTGLGIVLLVVFLYFISLSNVSPEQGSSNMSTRYWIMGSRVFDDMVSNAQSKDALINDTIYVIYSGNISLSSASSNLHIVKTAYFTSEASLNRAVMDNTLPVGTQALLYDNENWAETPANEKVNPVFYYKQAFALARSHNLLMIATPGNDSIDQQIAPYANVVDIQAQESQASVSEYDNKVLPIANAIKKANPSAIILSGLSTNPHAGVPTPNQLVDDARSVYGNVQGFWLNIPNKPANCTLKDTGGRCAGPQPQIGQQFLAQLGSK